MSTLESLQHKYTLSSLLAIYFFTEKLFPLLVYINLYSHQPPPL